MLKLHSIYAHVSVFDVHAKGTKGVLEGTISITTIISIIIFLHKGYSHNKNYNTMKYSSYTIYVQIQRGCI